MRDDSKKTTFYSRSETEFLDSTKTLEKSYKYKTTYYMGEKKLLMRAFLIMIQNAERLKAFI